MVAACGSGGNGSARLTPGEGGAQSAAPKVLHLHDSAVIDGLTVAMTRYFGPLDDSVGAKRNVILIEVQVTNNGSERATVDLRGVGTLATHQESMLEADFAQREDKGPHPSRLELDPSQTHKCVFGFILKSGVVPRTFTIALPAGSATWALAD